MSTPCTEPARPACAGHVLEAARNRASPLAQLLESAPRSPGLRALLRTLPPDPRGALALLCDVNDKFGADLVLYRLNERRVLRWLVAKAAQFKAAIAAHPSSWGSFSHAASSASKARKLAWAK